MLSVQRAFETSQSLLPLQEAAAACGDHQPMGKFPNGLGGLGEDGLGQLRIAEVEEAPLAAAMGGQGKGGLAGHAVNELTWLAADLAGAKAQMAGVVVEDFLVNTLRDQTGLGDKKTGKFCNPVTKGDRLLLALFVADKELSIAAQVACTGGARGEDWTCAAAKGLDVVPG